MNENQKAFMAQKAILDDQKLKKVRFDETNLNKIHNNEKIPTKNIVDANRKKREDHERKYLP